MFDKKCFLTICVLILVFSVLELSSFISESCAACFSVVGKTLICAFLSGFLLDIVGSKILKTKIDANHKAVFITGCDSGMGYHLAKRLDSRGFNVFAGCLSPLKGGGLELTETCSKRLRIIHIDITRNDSVLEAKEFIRNNLGKLDLWAVVNNAGIYRGYTAELCTLDHFKDVFDVNVMGTVRVTKAFLPLLRQSKGRLVNINSMAGRLCVPYMTAYSMTKHATVALTECLQQEMSRSGVKVISIEPEFFQTSIVSGDLLKKLMMESVDSLGDDIKDVYNEKETKHIENTSRILFSHSSPNIDIVIDDIERAISAVYPDSEYRPCRNWSVKLLFYVGQFLPKVVAHNGHIMFWEFLGKRAR